MEHLSNQDILDAALMDWRKLAQGLHARFDSPDAASGIRFLEALAAASQEADHYPEVRLTQDWVELKLVTRDDGWWVTDRDVDLARRISQIAEETGVKTNPKAVTQLELGLDTADLAALAPFWAALMTGTADNVLHDDVMDPSFRVPNLWFQGTAPHKTPRQRFHIDLWLAHDAADERIAAAIAAGGVVVDDSNAPSFVVLADPDGNRACVCTCVGR
jgi:4a-hydroxytetrahydrobiopterin dehydratase